MKPPPPAPEPTKRAAFFQGAVAAAMVVALLALGGVAARSRQASRASSLGAWLTDGGPARVPLAPAGERLVSSHLPWGQETQRLQPGSWRGDTLDPGLYLRSNQISGSVEGPVAQLRVHRTYVYENPRWAQRPGAHTSEDLDLPPVTALHDFWITEHGVRIPAVVRDHEEARADFDRTVQATRDPGLLEWRGQSRASFELYPVLLGGVPKQASWRQDSILEPDAAGQVTLPLSLHGLPTRKLEIDLRIHEPRGVRAWTLPKGLRAAPEGPGRWRIQGRFQDLARVPSPLLLCWTLAEAPRRTVRPLRGLSVRGGGYLAQGVVPGLAEQPVPLTLVGLDPEMPTQAGTLSAPEEGTPVLLEPAGTAPLDVDRATLERLSAMTRILAAHYDPARGSARERAREVAELSRRFRVVSPTASLYAKPGLETDATLEARVGDLHRPSSGSSRSASRPATPPRPGPRIRFGSALVPSFTAARRRANRRACFANQKTIAGAAEMYNLDFNMNLVEDWPTVNRLGPAHLLAPLLRPAPGVAVHGAHAHELWARRTGPGTRWLRMGDLSDIFEREGYLQQYPRDPGRGGEDAYLMIQLPGDSHGGPALFCKNHGFIQPPGDREAPPRNQLWDSGVRDPQLLEEASPTMMHGRPASVSLTHLGELELLMLWCLGGLVWTLGAQAPGRRRGLVRYLAFLGTSFALTVGFQVPEGAPVVRWTLTGGLMGMVTFVVILALQALATTSTTALLGTQGHTAGHPWSRFDSGTRTRMRASVHRNHQYVRDLGRIASAVLFLGLAGLLAAASAAQADALSSLLGMGALAVTFGLVLGVELTVDTLRWIEGHEGKEFWSRHAGRAVVLFLFFAWVAAASGPRPGDLCMAATVTALWLAPRYLLAARFLGQFYEEVPWARAGALPPCGTLEA